MDDIGGLYMEGQDRKLLLYLGSLIKGGAERVAVNLAKYFTDEGWQVHILTKLQDKDEYEVPEGVTRSNADLTQEELTGSRVRNLHLRIQKLRNILKEQNPDVIVSFIGKNNFMAITAAKPLAIPVVACVRSAPEREYKKKMMYFLVNPMFKKAAGVVLQTKKSFSFFCPAVQQKAVILPNSLNPAFMREKYSGVRRNTIITVGRLDDNKNQILLIHAFELIANEFPDVTLVIYGDGPARNKWEMEVQSSEFKDRIQFAGLITDVQDKIQKDRIFVLPSIMEGMPNALIEAMALGLAVISTNCPCGGPKDLIGDDENGLLVPVNDEKAMADAIRKILNTPELESKLQENGYLKVQEFRPENVNSMWKNYLEDIIDKNPRR